MAFEKDIINAIMKLLTHFEFTKNRRMDIIVQGEIICKNNSCMVIMKNAKANAHRFINASISNFSSSANTQFEFWYN